jgi:uncharacterized protein
VAMRQICKVGAIFLLWPSFAMAQENTPLIGSQASEQPSSLIAPTLNDGVMRLLVIGDSMAGGLGAGMTRMAQSDGGVQIVNRFNESSALTRPDVYDWAAAVPKIMEGKNFNAAVVLIGLNDRQDIRSASGKLGFNTPEWTKAYEANVDGLLNALIAQNVKVFWLGEPPMGDAAYDADMKTITALQRERVAAKGGVFIDTRPALSNPDGSYMDFGPDDTGEVKKLRQRDGVTFLKQGNNKFGQFVLAAIKSGDAQPAPVVASAPDGAPVNSEEAGPVFGQSDANGAAILHDSTTIAANVEVSAKPGQTTPAISAFQGKLFTTGEAEVAPAGRFDDFSYVAPPSN